MLQARGLLLYQEQGEPCRQFWASTDLEAWLDDLPHAAPPRNQGGRWRGEAEPLEQVSALLDQYAYNPAFKNATLMVNLRPQREGVWELRTEDVRIFGWFYRRRVFVAHRGALKGYLTSAEYDLCRKAVIEFRRTLRLPPPDYVYDQEWLPRDYL